MIDIIITSYNEPKATLIAVNAFLSQKINSDFRITVCDPFPEVEEFLKKNVKDKRFNFFLDPGDGKSVALNILINELNSKNNSDIFIFTDGDVHVSENSVNEIFEEFKDEETGCVTGKPVSLDDRKIKLGYWSHLLFDGINKVRKKLSDEKRFFECSGYLFAIRKGVIEEFPIDASEDSIIPHLFWKKGYKIKYSQMAEVYVKNPTNWKDWKTQKKRNIKGHENLKKISPNIKRTKSFFNEVKHGFFYALFYSRNVKEFFWTINLFLARFLIYIQAFKELRKKEVYSDGWRETEINSTKPFD